MNEFGPWDQFVSLVNRAGFAWKNLLGQDRSESWTPGISFGDGTTGLTYSFQNGAFYRVGRLVVCTFNLQLSAKGTSTGAAKLTGLPFTVAAGDANNSAQAFYWANMASTLVTVVGFVPANFAAVTILGLGAAAQSLANLVETDFGDSTALSGRVIYLVK